MSDNGIPADVIEAELEKILASRAFTKGDRASRFLRFVVEWHLKGKSAEIKEYVVGVEVLGKRSDFDPRTDTIVRAEARRLRARLDQYYASEGEYDSVKISVPKGSYAPQIEQNNATTDDKHAQPGKAGSRRHLMQFLFALGAIAISGGLLWRFSPSWPSDTEPFPTPLTSYPGRVASPSFSPDGNQVAFAWRPSPQSHSNIYAKLIGVNEPLRLTNNPADDYGPGWSPDGQLVAFLRVLSPGRDGVFLVPSIGGSPRKVAEIFSTGLSDFCAWQPAWHPGGRWLIIADKDSADGPFKLFAVSPTTGERRPLTSPPPKSPGDLYPAFSPNGRTLAFSRFTGNNVSDLWALPLSDDLRATKEPQRITSESFYIGNSAWTPDGRAIVFSGGDFHSPSLWKIAIGARPTKPSRLGFPGEGATMPAISRQGHLAYGREILDADIWRMDLADPSHPTSKLISSTRLDHTCRFSPDGKRIAFASNRSGSHELWVSNSDGSNAVKLTSVGGFGYRASPRWSPDGQWVYFEDFARGNRECRVIRSDGGNPARVNNLPEGCPTGWSPGGGWIYFGWNGQVWKMPTQGGPPVQITHGGGTEAMPSADGKLLYYRKTDGDITSLWSVPVKGGKETQVIESVCADNVAVTPRGIYFVSNASVQFLNFASGKIGLIARTGHVPAWGFDVSPDGSSLLYARFEIVFHDLMFVEKFSRVLNPDARF
jgi:Tol biopolymer transport system component